MTKAIFTLLVVSSAHAGDWPQWLGPERNGVSTETGLHWPKSKPKVQWRIPLGNGFSGISIAAGRVFTMFAAGGDEYAVCVSA